MESSSLYAIHLDSNDIIQLPKKNVTAFSGRIFTVTLQRLTHGRHTVTVKYYCCSIMANGAVIRQRMIVVYSTLAEKAENTDDVSLITCVEFWISQ